MLLTELARLRHPLSAARLSAFDKISKDKTFLAAADAQTRQVFSQFRQAIPDYDKWSGNELFLFIGLISAIRRALIKSGESPVA